MRLLKAFPLLIKKTKSLHSFGLNTLILLIMRFRISLIAIFSLFFTPFLKAQVYYEDAGWTQHGELTYTAFGWSMSNAGDVNGDGFDDMIVSAIDYSNPEETNGEEGKLYLFFGSASGLSTEPDWQFESDDDSIVLGFSTDGGDLNGDGYSDIVAGALQYNNGQYNEGAVFLWYGSPTGPNLGAPDWILEYDQVFALLGSGVALSGDINSDGYNDLFVSAKMWDGPEVDEGKTWLFWGSPDGPVASGWSWEPNQEGSISGFPANYAGDVNGDGFDDVIIGANQYDSVYLDDGLAVAFYGSATGLNAVPDWSVSSGQKKCNFGHWVDGAGDVNGDGFDDVVVAALLYESDTATGNEGRIFVYYGSADGLQTDVAWFGEINQEQAQFGYSCAGAGDINNDGYDDVIGGSKYWDNGNIDEGAAFVWFGSPEGLETDFCWSGEGNQDYGYYGRHVGGNADFNQDGYSDFMVGAYRYSEILEADGKAFVYFGAPRESDFHFLLDSFCLADTNPFPVIDGLNDGIFYSDDAVVNGSTGEVDLISSGSGLHTIYYQVGVACAIHKKIFIEDNSGISIFHFVDSIFCIEDINPVAIFDTDFPGTFYSDADINTETGEINLINSGEGIFTIYFTGNSPLGCVYSDSNSIQIYPSLNADFEYASTTLFIGDINAAAILIGESGEFSVVPEGLVFADLFGTIDLINSLHGVYTITNFIDSICNAIANFSVEILPTCTAPQNIIITDIKETSFTASWDGDDNYSDYSLYLISGTDTTVFSSGDTSYVFSDLNPDNMYTLIIEILCTDSVSNISANAVITTLPLGILNSEINNTLILYPNPASNNIYVESVDGIKKYNFELHNLNGQVISIKSKLFKQNVIEINVRNLSPGIYILTATSEERREVYRVIID